MLMYLKHNPGIAQKSLLDLNETNFYWFRVEVPTMQHYMSSVQFNVKDKAVVVVKKKTRTIVRIEKLDSRHNVSFSSFLV